MFRTGGVEINETFYAQYTFSVSLPAFKIDRWERTCHNCHPVCTFLTFPNLFTFIIIVYVKHDLGLNWLLRRISGRKRTELAGGM
jgi:hypothetical protein